MGPSELRNNRYHMSDYNKTKKKLKPTNAFPELVNKLARASYHSRKLHEILADSSVANILGIRKQSFDYHVKKVEKELK